MLLEYRAGNHGSTKVKPFLFAKAGERHSKAEQLLQKSEINMI
jgi:hypothetical protein